MGKKGEARMLTNTFEINPTTVMMIKVAATVLVLAAWALIIWRQKWASLVLLVAPGVVIFIAVICGFLGSMLSFGQFDSTKFVNQVINQMLKDVVVVLVALVMTIGVGVGWFVL